MDLTLTANLVGGPWEPLAARPGPEEDGTRLPSFK